MGEDLMWTNQPLSKAPEASPAQGYESPIVPTRETTARHTSSSVASNISRLGSTLAVKGTISGTEDLQVDGKVEGHISLSGQKITVGPAGQLNAEVTVREALIQGKLSGNICAGERVEIKKGSEVIGDITTARIAIEDGAHFKGAIEIDRTKSSAVPDDGRSVVSFGN